MSKSAQQRIAELFNSTVADQNLVYNFNLYNRSVQQKIWSTQYYSKRLIDLVLNDFRVFPSASSTQSYSLPPTSQTPMLDIEDYSHHLNLFLDGFFMNAMSTLDTLSHELFTLYVSRSTPGNIYITDARDMLLDEHPNSAVGIFLNNQLGRQWFADFKPFRHCTTHESLIRFDNIVYRFDHITGDYKLSRSIKLPDNPQVRPFTYNRNRLANKYVTSTFKRINRLVSEIYRNALRDIRAGGNVLPVPAP